MCPGRFASSEAERLGQRELGLEHLLLRLLSEGGDPVLTTTTMPPFGVQK
jgi:hypothetical protein